MINFSALVKAIVALVLSFFSQSTSIPTNHMAMLDVGAQIDGMTLTKGAANAKPLWAFCASTVDKNLTTADCRVPQIQNLAIGHVFLGREDTLKNADWSRLTWNLILDNKPLNLDQFGTYEYVLPTMSPNPSYVREVFMQFKAWDVVLTNLQPGEHTLEGMVRSDVEEYRWKVKLIIEDKSTPKESSYDQHQDSWDAQPVCDHIAQWPSGYGGSCQSYG